MLIKFYVQAKACWIKIHVRNMDLILELFYL
jgi:hypothetical protein